MHVELNYGRRRLPVELPDDLQITMVRKPVMPVLMDPLTAVRRALQDPVGSTIIPEGPYVVPFFKLGTGHQETFAAPKPYLLH